MKKIKKAVAFFLVFSLFLGLCSWASAAKPEKAEPTVYDEAIDLFRNLTVNDQSILSAIGGETLGGKPQSAITRNEAAALINAFALENRTWDLVARDYVLTGAEFCHMVDILLCTYDFFAEDKQYDAYVNKYLAGIDLSWAEFASQSVSREQAILILLNTMNASVQYGKEWWKFYEEFGIYPEISTDHTKTDEWNRPVRRWIKDGSPITDWHTMPANYIGTACDTTHDVLNRLGIVDEPQYSNNRWCMFDITNNGAEEWSCAKLHWYSSEESNCQNNFIDRKPGSRMEIYELGEGMRYVTDINENVNCKVFYVVIIDEYLAKIEDRHIQIYAPNDDVWSWEDENFPTQDGYYLVNVTVKDLRYGGYATAYVAQNVSAAVSPQRGMELPNVDDGKNYVYTDMGRLELSQNCSLGLSEIIDSMEYYYSAENVFFFFDSLGYVIGAIDPDTLSPSANPEYFAASASSDTLSIQTAEASPICLNVTFGKDLEQACSDPGVLLTCKVKCGKDVIRTVAEKMPAQYANGKTATTQLYWDGRNDQGLYAAKGSYDIELTAEYYLDSSTEIQPYFTKTASFPVHFTPPIISFISDGAKMTAELNTTCEYKAYLARYTKSGQYESVICKTGSEPTLTFSVPTYLGKQYKLILTTSDDKPIDTKTVNVDLPLVDEAALIPAEQHDLYMPQSSEQKPVIFIRDGGSGDGSSANSPLSLVDSENVFDVDPETGESPERQYNSLLYQAASKLYGTGGTIVICGEVLCDGSDGRGTDEFRELVLPHLGGAGITITSVYDGVDYRQTNNARLILQSPVLLSCCNPVTFRDLTLCTMASETTPAAGRSIGGCGFPLVFDTGITCKVLDANKNEIAKPSDNQYLSVYGGHRYIMHEGGTDVTLRSGTFYSVCAGNNGVSLEGYGQLYGDSHLTIEGTTTVLGTISGTTLDSRGLQDGNSYVTIRGGNIRGNIQMSSSAGFSNPNCKEYLTITGGTFGNTTRFLATVSGSYFGNKPSYSLFDCSQANNSALLATKASNFTQIAIGASAVTGGTITKLPYRTVFYEGDAFDPSGMTVSLSTSLGTKTFSADHTLASLRFVANGTELQTDSGCMQSDMTAVSVFYANRMIGVIPVTVCARPAISILGTYLAGSGEKKDLNFAFGIADTDDEIAVTGCGVKVYPTELLEDPSELYNGTLAGGLDIECTRKDLCRAPGFPEGTMSAAVKGIPIEEYGEAYTAVAYYTLLCGDETVTVYSQPLQASVYDTAKRTANTQVVSLADSGAKSSYDAELVAEKVKIVTDYMTEMAFIPWHTDEEINFVGISDVTANLYYHAGQTYYGIPYIGGYTGQDNLEQFQTYLDESGRYTGPTDWTTMHGNNCTSSIFQSMSLVSNHYDYWLHLGDPVWNIVPRMHNDKAPVQPVGNLDIRSTDALTPVIVQRNGYPALYEAYAQMREGDYLFCHVNGSSNIPWSHLRLVRSINVVRYPDGSIDPHSSMIYFAEQTSFMHDEWNTTWGTNTQYSFIAMANEAYVPVRDTALCTGYFETPHVVIHNANNENNIANGISGTVISNYDLSQVKLTVRNLQTGETVLENSAFGYHNRVCPLAKLDPQNVIQSLAAQGGYEYVLTVSAANETQEYIRFCF